MTQASVLQDPKRVTDAEVNTFLNWKKERMDRIIKLDELCDDIETRNSEYGDTLLSSKRKGVVGNVTALVSTLAAPFSGGLSLIGVAGSVGLFVNGTWNDYIAKSNVDTAIAKADTLINKEEGLYGKVIDIIDKLQYGDDIDLAAAHDFVEVYVECGSDDADAIRFSDNPYRRVQDDVLGVCQPSSAVAIGAANMYKTVETVEKGSGAAKKACDCTKAVVEAAGKLKSTGDGTKAIVDTSNAVRQTAEGIKATSDGVKCAMQTADVLQKTADGVRVAEEGIQLASETANVVAKALEAAEALEEGTQAMANAASHTAQAANAGKMATDGVSAAQNTVTATLQNVPTKLANVSKFGLALNAIFIPVSIYQLISHEHPDSHPKVNEIRQTIMRLLTELQEYNTLVSQNVEHDSRTS